MGMETFGVPVKGLMGTFVNKLNIDALGVVKFIGLLKEEFNCACKLKEQKVTKQ
jgi:acyl carrier protein